MKPLLQYSGLGLLLLMIRIEHVKSGRRRRSWDVTPDPDDPDTILTPSFVDTPSRVTFRQGQEARLECAVDDLGTKKVIWRRRSDPNPLTIQHRTFVADQRFSVEHEPLGPDWTLLIHDVRMDDAGRYECQVMSRGHDLRRGVKLTVKRGKPKNKVKPEINIIGSTFVEMKHTITLVCNATGDVQSPDDLDWFHEGQKLDSGQNDKISIEKKVSLTAKTINSVLRISPAAMEDKGIYVCRTSDLQIDSVRVDVLNADTNNVKRGERKLRERERERTRNTNQSQVVSTVDGSSSQARSRSSQGRSSAPASSRTTHAQRTVLLLPSLVAMMMQLKRFMLLPT